MSSAAQRGPRQLSGLRVLLGISGGIAAYKSAYLVRRLREAGAEVRCALTRSAEQFVAPLTLEVLSGHPVYRQEWLEASASEDESAGEELHMTAAQWADTVCVAPCTANTLGRLALGLAEDFLSTTAMAFDGPLLLAPAMHSEMWAKPAVQDNVDVLRRRGAWILGPAEGPLASGEIGMGRMAEPEAIVEGIAEVFRGALSGRTVVIDAGPTREPLDPVRYLGNRSSGKMGFALAEEAARRGARVILVAGPVDLPTPPRVERIDVETAVEMRDAVYEVAGAADVVILSAAVADFRPRQRRDQKIKKEQLEGDGVLRVELEPNPDILAGLADVAPQALRVGFAAETEKLEEHARAKLERKRVDFLVANDVSRSDIGFGSDHNEVTVLSATGEISAFGRRPKRELASALLDLFTASLENHASSAFLVGGRGRRTVMKPDGETLEVLRYLHDLGWAELYKEPPGSSLDPPEQAVDPHEERPSPPGAASAPSAEGPQRPKAAASQGEGDRASRLAVLEERALGCTACKLSAGRNKVVFGSGNPDADLMFIGEGPGAHEDRQGLPFVGPAGELLTKIISAIELSRDEVYIANMVKCRPPNNRDPEPEEVMACRSFLEQQIALVEPKVIVALGRVAAQTLLETDRSLGKMRGEWFLIQGVETRVTYHPAALLRNASFKRPVWEDMQLVRDRLKELA